MDGLSMITSIVIVIINLLILLSPFISGWILYSYISSKLIYSFAKRYFDLNISFSRTWTITFLSGMIYFIIDIILFIFYNSISILFDISRISTFVDFIFYIVILSVILGILTVFIVSLIAYKYLSNVNLKAAIFTSFADLLAYLSFTIMVIIVGSIIVQYLYSILFPPPPRTCCTLHYIK